MRITDIIPNVCGCRQVLVTDACQVFVGKRNQETLSTGVQSREDKKCLAASRQGVVVTADLFSEDWYP